MLEEYKNIYSNYTLDNDLKKKDRNELLRIYVDTGDESYLAAAIYKFWYILNNKLNNNKNNKFVEPEDFYGMFIDSILETCKNKLWLDKNHNLYNDKKAPEKSINTIFNSKVINYFHACNRQKRKPSFEKIALTEYVTCDSILKSDTSKLDENITKENINDLIITLFNKKDYYASYILDMIVNHNVFSLKYNKISFNKKKLKHYLMNMSDDYCHYFSNNYQIDYDRVKYSTRYIKGMSYDYIEKKIDKSLNSLCHNEILINFLGR